LTTREKYGIILDIMKRIERYRQWTVCEKHPWES